MHCLQITQKLVTFENLPQSLFIAQSTNNIKLTNLTVNNIQSLQQDESINSILRKTAARQS